MKELRQTKLTFGLEPEVDLYRVSARLGFRDFRKTSCIVRSVTARDHHTCQFCGFRSAKYQQIVPVSEPLRDLNNLVTSCIFCEQVAHLNLVPQYRSGVLIWLPEVSQIELNRVMPAVYVCRITQGLGATKARSVLDRLVETRGHARRRFGSDDPEELVKSLRTRKEGMHAQLQPPVIEEGLRLMPLDRRIVRESELEFNQFPQILAFWRSKNGPLYGEKASTILEHFIERLTKRDGPYRGNQ
ncbi:conserved protein of unknown function [Nitrospira japonica]|uniref:HNH endonuclease n=1 Tax=Nitrospira japonica TaxID=1325564 RepID=A0A1W1I4X1_9BACT|nr:type IV secretion protein DotN [Nitrospira japonica]SLM48077.1 conserved protein of unknown function [Nitrospira japonica]